MIIHIMRCYKVTILLNVGERHVVAIINLHLKDCIKSVKIHIRFCKLTPNKMLYIFLIFKFVNMSIWVGACMRVCVSVCVLVCFR